MAVTSKVRPHQHEWVVFSTILSEGSLFVQCVDCGASGTVDDPTRKEWKRAFHAPSRPYRWHDEARIHQRLMLPMHVVRTIPCQQCDCPNRRRSDAKYERFPAEIITPDVALTSEEREELHELSAVVHGSDLCSLWFPVFLEGYQQHTGRHLPPAVINIANRIEKFHRKGLHCSPAVVARVLAEFSNTPAREEVSEWMSRISNVLPTRDHYWLLHDGEKFARHGTDEKNGVLVFECQERAEQFLLTVGKELPTFKPVQVHPATFVKEAKRMGAFSVPGGELGLKVCEISKAD